MPSIVARCCSQIGKGLHLPHSDWLESRQRKTLNNARAECVTSRRFKGGAGETHLKHLQHRRRTRGLAA
jgi:hypothetical protein